MTQMPRIPTQKHLYIPLCFPGPLVASAWPCVCPHPDCGNPIVPPPASETLSLVFSQSLDTSAQKEQCHNPQYYAHTMGKALVLSIPVEPTRDAVSYSSAPGRSFTDHHGAPRERPLIFPGKLSA